MPKTVVDENHSIIFVCLIFFPYLQEFVLILYTSDVDNSRLLGLYHLWLKVTLFFYEFKLIFWQEQIIEN